jgi:hypothetical protein
MAQSTLWVTIASLLAVFDINKAIGEDGKVLEPSYEYHSSVVACVSNNNFLLQLKYSQNALALQMFHQTEIERIGCPHYCYLPPIRAIAKLFFSVRQA